MFVVASVFSFVFQRPINLEESIFLPVPVSPTPTQPKLKQSLHSRVCWWTPATQSCHRVVIFEVIQKPWLQEWVTYIFRFHSFRLLSSIEKYCGKVDWLHGNQQNILVLFVVCSLEASLTTHTRLAFNSQWFSAPSSPPSAVTQACGTKVDLWHGICFLSDVQMLWTVNRYFTKHVVFCLSGFWIYILKREISVAMSGDFNPSGKC